MKDKPIYCAVTGQGEVNFAQGVMKHTKAEACIVLIVPADERVVMMVEQAVRPNATHRLNLIAVLENAVDSLKQQEANAEREALN